MSAAPATIATAPSTRQLGAALVAVVVALALGAALAFGSLAAAKPQAPGTGTAPITHDRGWATDSSAAGPAAGAPVINDRGWATDSSASGTAAGGSTSATGRSTGGSGGASSSRVRLAN